MAICNLSADFLLDILERQNNLIVRVDAENRFLYISKAYADFFGLDQESMLGRIFIPPIYEEDIPIFEQTHRQIRETKQPASLVQRELTQNGWAYFEWKITPILDENGDIKEIQSVGHDITNLVSTKEALSQTTSLLYTVIHSSPDMIFVKDFNGNYKLVNKSFADKLGYPPEYFVNKNEREFFSDMSTIKLFESQNEIAKNSQNTISLEEQKIVFKDEERYFDMSLSPLFADEKGPSLYFVVARDITEKLNNRERTRLLFQALEQSSAAIIITDIDGLITYANRKFKEMYRYEDSDLIGCTPRVLKSGLTDDRVYRQMWETILAGEEFNCELTNKTKDGELKWVLISVSPIKNEKGEITHFVGVSEDIGFQKRLEGELRNAKQKLENINEALEKEVEERTSQLMLSNMMLRAQIAERKKIEEEKEQKEKLLSQQSKLASLGEMINMIAHQWRQPLTAISTAAINIKTKQELGLLNESVLDSILDNILSHTQKMSGTINDFMNFFKPSKEREYFSMQEAVDESVKLIGAQLAARGITIIQDTACAGQIYGFKNELEQVLINIFSNARDAFETSSIQDKTIYIAHKCTGDVLEIEVCDNAGGIEEAILDRVFEPYFTTKEPGKGTGIGLYMSKIILQKSFNGDMKIENRYENGVRIGAKCTITINQQKGLSHGN